MSLHPGRQLVRRPGMGAVVLANLPRTDHNDTHSSGGRKQADPAQESIQSKEIDALGCHEAAQNQYCFAEELSLAYQPAEATHQY